MRCHIVEGSQLLGIDLAVLLILETLIGGKGVCGEEVGIAYLVDDILACRL
jgi:hypothetical protein